MSRADRTTLFLAVATGGLLLGWLLSVAYAFSPFAPQPEPFVLQWRDEEALSRGTSIYAARCAMCHGVGGEGVKAVSVRASKSAAAPLDASGHAWKQPDFALVELVRSGASPAMCLTLSLAMPRFTETLSDREIAEVLAYVKSRWPAEQRAFQDEVNAVHAAPNAVLRRQLGLE